MKIISTFRDYYDGVARQLDPSPTPLYTRSQRVLPVGSTRSRHRKAHTEAPWPVEFQPLRDLWEALPDYNEGAPPERGPTPELRMLISFCGTVVPVYAMLGELFHSPRELLHDLASGETVRRANYARALSEREHSDQLSDRDHELLRSIPRVMLNLSQRQVDEQLKHRGAYYTEHPDLCGASVDHYESVAGRLAAQGVGALDAAHRLLEAPVFAISSGYAWEGQRLYASTLAHADMYREHLGLVVCTTNPQLAPLRFGRVLKPVVAWQWLDQYMNGPLATQRDVPQSTGGDKIKRDAHGFDDMSFKNGPGQGKKARRRNRA